MLATELKRAVTTSLSDLLGNAVRVLGSKPVGGGCIHQATQIKTNQGDYFLKFNHLGEAENFSAEVHGLEQLANTKTLSCVTSKHAFILMEFLPPAPPAPQHWEIFGAELAALHRSTAPQYGLGRPNFIGRLHQSNQPHDVWVDFFIQERLEAQLKLAEQNGLASSDLRRSFEALYPRLEQLLPQEPASLLHGDLWSGNFLIGPEGKACVVDPAVYHGHREAELSFTTLFGGFDQRFYAAYQEAWPLQPGWRERIDLFNLYPLLVHLNLFGSGYLSQIRSILRIY